jgi:glycerophosphoryl diester phosphodiesterase
MGIYPVKVLAHRGGGSLSPENTIAALRCGLSHGFYGVEFDVMDAADGLVLMHDPELGRTAAGRGSIADCAIADLAALDAGAWFGEAFVGEPVPSFAMARDFCVTHGIWMNAEIKPVPGTEFATGRQVALACAALPAGSVLLSSFAAEALVAAREAVPALPRALLVEAVPDDWLAQLKALDAVAQHAKASLLTPAQAAAVKAAGYGLLCYTVNDPAQVRALLAIGVDAICTDRLDLIGPDFA